MTATTGVKARRRHLALTAMLNERRRELVGGFAPVAGEPIERAFDQVSFLCTQIETTAGTCLAASLGHFRR
jgi:hypothetical protein